MKAAFYKISPELYFVALIYLPTDKIDEHTHTHTHKHKHTYTYTQHMYTYTHTHTYINTNTLTYTQVSHTSTRILVVHQQPTDVNNSCDSCFVGCFNFSFIACFLRETKKIKVILQSINSLLRCTPNTNYCHLCDRTNEVHRVHLQLHSSRFNQHLYVLICFSSTGKKRKHGVCLYCYINLIFYWEMYFLCLCCR